MIPAKVMPAQKAIELQSVLSSTRRESASMVTECDTGIIKLNDLVSSRLQALINYKESIETISSINGVSVAYNDLYTEVFDFDAEILLINSAIQSTVDFIVDQIPKDGVYLSIIEFDTDYKLVQREVTNSAAVSNLKSLAQSIVDLIEI